MAKVKPFSSELEEWLKTDQPKTFARLEEVFGERTFAIIFLVFMALPALPIPTGGITHVLEVLTMLIALQQVAGRKKLWIPKFVSKKELPASFVHKLLPPFMRRIKWLEKYSRRRGAGMLTNTWFSCFVGLCVLGLTVGAFLAPPFSGLDTVPALGVVIIALGLIVGDISFFVAGLIIGSAGVILEITVGAVVVKAVKRFLAHSSGMQKGWAVSLLIVIILALFLHHRHGKKHDA